MYNFRSIKAIEGLDGLRLIAVGLVLFGHFGIPGIPGGLGVTIFFFLSGFLITTLLFQELRANNSISVFKFYVRRALRLGPELVGLLVVSTGIGILIKEPPHVLDIVSALLYFSNYYFAMVSSNVFGDIKPYWNHLWSLAVEEHYYLTFPLIFGWMMNGSRNKGRAIGFFAVVLAGCLLWRIFLVVEDVFPLTWINPYTYMASEARFDSIAYGALLAFVAQRPARLPTLAGFAAFIAGMAIVIMTLAIRNDVFRETIRYSLQGLGLMLIFGHLYLAESRSVLMPLLANRFMQIGGMLSYGAYLWHGEVLRLYHFFGIDLRTGHVVAQLPYISAGIVITFAIAAASYQFIARPALNLRRKFGSHAHEDVKAAGQRIRTADPALPGR